jgi:tetratricopeptide (TPR) repeat protein
MINTQSSAFRISLLIILLVLCGSLYSFGVSPLFILDDEPNLSELGRVKKYHNILEFISQGSAGPLGRPISLASFALQADAWADATQFKYVNIFIHLLIGIFIYNFLSIIGRILKWSQITTFRLSIICTTLWLLSPIQVSTVLYVVQRMAQLSVLFTIIGLVVYVKGREYLLQGKLKKGYITVSLGLILGGLLALFSKENGILIILYTWVVEATLFHSLPSPKGWKIWKSIFIYIPITIIISYFIFTFQPELAYSNRSFTLVERLYSESRILFSYLGNVFVPHSFNLFQDDYVVSKSLFEPPSTFISLASWVILFFSAILLRKRYSVFSFGVLWYLAGHALESTIVPLILYFEHRNYLAVLGPLIILIACFSYLIQNNQLTTVIRKSFLGLSIGWALIIITSTISEISLWRNPLLQSVHWAEEKPLSRFAQSHAASMFLALNQPQKALEYYQYMANVFSDDPAPYTLWLFAACKYEEIPPPNMELALDRFFQAKESLHIATGLDPLLNAFTTGDKCKRFSPEIIEKMLSSLIANPNLTINRGLIYLYYANWTAYKGDYKLAIQHMDEALKYSIVKKDIAKLQKLAWLMQLNLFEEAVLYIKQLRLEFNSVENKIHASHLDSLEKIAVDFVKMKTMKKENQTP